MKKALCYCEYIIYILVINMATFILRPMDWNVLSGKLLAFNWPSIAEFISNLLIFILSIFIIACFFKPEKKFPLSMFAEVFFKKILLPSVAIRFAADIIYFFADLLFKPSYAVAFITEAVCMFLIFNIIKRKLGGGETAAAGKSSKYGFIGGIIVLLIIIGFYIYYYNSTELLRRYAEAKFTEPTSVYDSGTAAFRLDLIRLMYSIALWISLFFRFGLFDSYCQRRAADYKFFVLIVRCMCITVILFLGIVIKTLVLPNGTLLITHRGALFVSKSSPPVISEVKIYRNCNEMDLVRLTGYQKHELVYRNFHIMLKYDGKTLLKFNKMAERGKLHKIEVKSADHMYRYEFDALIYSKDDVPFVIKFKDINKYNMRDEALIEACEKLISEGYFEAFEFACEYLLAYDEDFIKPVIEIYSQEEPDYFDEDFISRRNSYIKPEYMKEFARSIR